MTFFGEFSDWITLSLLGSTRLAVAFLVAPFLGAGPLTGLTRRIFLIIAIVVMMPQWMAHFPDAQPGPLDTLLLTLKEAAIGAVIGFIYGAIFWAIESAGELIDLQRGSTAAGVFNPSFGAVNSPLGGLFLHLCVVMFYATGGFLAFLDTIYQTFQIYPLMSMLPERHASDPSAVIGLATSLFRSALLLAAPFLITFLLTDLGLGLMNRFVPQLNVFFLSMSIKSALGIFLLIFYFTIMVKFMDKNLPGAREVKAFLASVLS